MKHKPAMYEAIRMWHVESGSFAYYWRMLQERASESDAPLDAIFEQELENGSKAWVSASSLTPDHPFRVRYFTGNPDLQPEVRAAIWLRFGKAYDDALAVAILKRIQWDNLLGCWSFTHGGIFYGVERDGYIHT